MLNLIQFKMHKVKFDNTIEQCRAAHSKVSKGEHNGRYSVIVACHYAKWKAYYGVQFWTAEDIKLKSYKSAADGTNIFFVEYL